MDTNREYVEVYNDERGKTDKRGRASKLRRYKDDAYRYPKELSRQSTP